MTYKLCCICVFVAGKNDGVGVSVDNERFGLGLFVQN